MAEAPSPDQGRTRQRLLIVDDDVDLATTMAALAESRGYTVMVAHDGLAFRRAMESFVPDRLVLDLALPDCDGLELLRFLAARRCTCPIVVVSSHDQRMLDMVPSLGEGFGLDVRGVLQKPFPGSAFLGLL